MTEPQDRDARMTLSPRDIRELLDVLANSVWDEAVVTVGDVTIAVARNGATLPGSAPATPPTAVAAPVPVAAAPAPIAVSPGPAPSGSVPAPVPVAGSAVTATSPSVGVFWRAPEPGAAPFVAVGDLVEAGQELCIVEVMKLMNRVAAPSAGTIVSIHVDNGDAVEFGTALFSIEPSSRP